MIYPIVFSTLSISSCQIRTKALIIFYKNGFTLCSAINTVYLSCFNDLPLVSAVLTNSNASPIAYIIMIQVTISISLGSCLLIKYLILGDGLSMLGWYMYLWSRTGYWMAIYEQEWGQDEVALFMFKSIWIYNTARAHGIIKIKLYIF